MSVKKVASGRRSVQVEVAVPGTLEEVWQAVATGPGISSWFVPAEFEESDGKPAAVKLNFGPGMESRSVRVWCLKTILAGGSACVSSARQTNADRHETGRSGHTCDAR